ncbi:Glycosyl transferase group 2 family protein [Phytophthora palmivora]|uniref:Glycosyl transferase group 2 family protein n=1 Tax=Phytophthora palmivora TaxID=4796 RepID=A0A2P4YPQ0_9STRA|nr:Glycosyl transferase group 2 family protein [Phytophthora palmivora]
MKVGSLTCQGYEFGDVLRRTLFLNKRGKVSMIKLPEKRCFLDILNRQLVIVFSGRIVESRDVKFREQWTIASDYIVQLFEKVFAHQSGVVLPATVPYVKLPLHDYTNSDSGDVVTSTSRISDYLGSVDDQQVGDDVVGEKRRTVISSETPMTISSGKKQGKNENRA